MMFEILILCMLALLGFILCFISYENDNHLKPSDIYRDFQDEFNFFVSAVEYNKNSERFKFTIKDEDYCVEDSYNSLPSVRLKDCGEAEVLTRFLNNRDSEIKELKDQSDNYNASKLADIIGDEICRLQEQLIMVDSLSEEELTDYYSKIDMLLELQKKLLSNQQD